MELLIWGTLGGLYALPFLVAGLRKHRNLAAIGLLNLLLGWTIVGWVGALVSAVYKEKS